MGKWKISILDSQVPVLFPDHRIQAVVYDPVWQGVRLSLSFTEVNLSRSLAMLNAYVFAAISDNEYHCRLYRARQVLKGIPVYRSSISVHKAETIQAERAEYETLIEVTDRSIIWDWNEARMQSHAMYNAAYNLFDQMSAELRLRATRPGKKLELRYFLGILDEVIDDKEFP